MTETEGFIDVTGGRVWYRRYGDGDEMPVLILHGGPGSASDYMQPLAERLSAHRPLITVGRYDEITPACSETLRAGIADSRMVVFEHSAHHAHLEEGELFASVVEPFLAEAD